MVWFLPTQQHSPVSVPIPIFLSASRLAASILSPIRLFPASNIVSLVRKLLAYVLGSRKTRPMEQKFKIELLGPSYKTLKVL